MFISVQCHGQFRSALPKGKKRAKHVVYATTPSEVLDYLKQFPALADLLKHGSFEVWVGPTMSKARNLTAELVANPNLRLAPGSTIHITAHTTGHEITSAMLITAAITAAVSVAVTIAMAVLFPPPSADTTKDSRKSVLYEGGLNTQKEGVPLPYVAGLDVLCGSNVIEGYIEHMNTGGAYGGPYGNFEFMGLNGGELLYGLGYHELNEAVFSSYKGGGGGKTLANTSYSDAMLRALFAYADGPVGGIKGSTREEKEQNIFINELPLRDPGTGTLIYNGFDWQERLGEEGQSAIPIIPGVSNNTDANVELKQQTSGGAQLYIPALIADPTFNRARVRIRINQLVSTDKKGNQQATSVYGGIEVKRESSSTWQLGASWGYSGKTSDPITIERDVYAPPALGNDKWQFRVYRTTPDSTDDKLVSNTSYAGYSAFKDVELSYDGAESDVPTATVGIAIDMGQFDTGGRMPEIAWRAVGRKVRIPSNYNPITRVYTGTWDGSWSTAATQNPVWHWFHLATDQYVGAGLAEAMFSKFSLYDVAKYCDGLVNGRPRYTLNKQFTDEQPGWQFLVELASSFRAFPYYNGSQIILVQDKDVSSPDHIVNNSQVEGGCFQYETKDLTQQYNVVRVEWDDPEDYFRKATVEYRDTVSIARNKAIGLSNGGQVVQTFYKVGCTNKQEAYDFARLLCYISQKEVETISFNTMLGAASYHPGQIIAVDDWLKSGKKPHGRIAGFNGSGKPLLDTTWTQKANTAYKAYTYIDNALVIRDVAQVSSLTTHTLIDIDATGIKPEMPCSIVEVNGVQPRWYRINDIQDAGYGKYTVTGTLYARGKFAFVEQNVTPPSFQYTAFTPKRHLPAPTGLTASGSFEQDDILGSIQTINVGWDGNTDPSLMLRGYMLEVLGPDGSWKTVYQGPNTAVSIKPALPGNYVFSLKSINTWGNASDVASLPFTLEYATGATPPPPVFIGFR